MSNPHVSISKFLSLVLRHKPETIGLRLDEAGWADVGDLIARCNHHGRPLTFALLEEVVRDSDKQRFAFNADRTQIRANQGHSVEIVLDLAPIAPPPLLFHGTASRFLPSIRAQGLVRGSRHHVHLSADAETAHKVGQRHGVPVVLEVRAAAMHTDGMAFYRSDNGVWLTAHVPVRYLGF